MGAAAETAGDDVRVCDCRAGVRAWSVFAGGLATNGAGGTAGGRACAALGAGDAADRTGAFSAEARRNLGIPMAAPISTAASASAPSAMYRPRRLRGAAISAGAADKTGFGAAPTAVGGAGEAGAGLATAAPLCAGCVRPISRAGRCWLFRTASTTIAGTRNARFCAKRSKPMFRFTPLSSTMV